VACQPVAAGALVGVPGDSRHAVALAPWTRRPPLDLPAYRCPRRGLFPTLSM